MLLIWLGIIAFASLWAPQSLDANPVNGWFVALVFCFAIDLYALSSRSRK